MSTWKILHNPKCSKSRQALKLLNDKGIKPEIIEYLKNPLTEKDLQNLLDQLLAKPAEVVRTKEEVYQELQFNINSKEEIIKYLAKYPILLERPIVIKNNVAVIGRPTENINQLL